MERLADRFDGDVGPPELVRVITLNAFLELWVRQWCHEVLKIQLLERKNPLMLIRSVLAVFWPHKRMKIGLFTV